MARLNNLKLKLRALGWRQARAEEWRESRVWFQTEVDPEGRTRCLGSDDSAYARELRSLCDWPDPYNHDQFVYRFRQPLLVEPLHGLICHGGEVLGFAHGIHQEVMAQKELPFRFPLALQRKRRVPRAVLLRHDYGETNYFHFYHDILTKILLLERFPEYREWPWLVSRTQFEQPFFQDFLQRMNRSRPEFIIQENEPIRVDDLVCLKGMGLTPSWLRGLWQLLQIPDASDVRDERVLLVRGPSARARLSHMEEIRDCCADYGFRVVDTASLSLDAQIELFRNTRHLVAEHGAGTTNILFRCENPMSVLELFPYRYSSSCYYLISKLLGYDYDLLFEQSARSDSTPRIEITELESRLRRMVGTAP